MFHLDVADTAQAIAHASIKDLEVAEATLTALIDSKDTSAIVVVAHRRMRKVISAMISDHYVALSAIDD